MKRSLQATVVIVVVIAVAIAAAAVAASTARAGSDAATASVAPTAIVGPVIHTAAGAGAPPTSAQCIAAYGIACYGPQDMRNEYDFNSAYANGWTGAGQTIVIFDAFGSPTIRQDLAAFDAAYNLPPPPSFEVYEPEGHVVLDYDNLPSPANVHNENIQTEVGWAYETTLDVQWAHAMAPAANIALVVTPIQETQGVQGLQNLQNAQQWVLDHHIGTIWSNSWSTTEQAFQNPSVIQRLDRFYAQAASRGVNAFYATDDTGVANTDKQGRLYPYPTVDYPSSSPNVISVGGTEILPPSTAITSYLPESVWNDGYGAGGGGYSTVFPKPAYQAAAVGGDQRGLPDVSYNSALISSILIYESFDPVYGPGWTPIGGTSAATPQWAAVAAIAQQARGADLGFLNPQLYALEGTPAFHDIVSGDNSFEGIPGYAAAPGWDAATGLGTPDVGVLASALSGH
jgi:subtilase family serine protease